MTWDEIVQAAVKVANEFKIPASIMIGQAALESGYGKSAPGYNFFGIKGQGTGGSQTLSTQEDYGRGMVNVKDTFATYAKPEDAFRAYAELITKDPRYQKAMLHRDDPVQFLQEIKNAGYATDPNYVNKVASIAFKYNMYDDPKLKPPTPTPTEVPENIPWYQNLFGPTNVQAEYMPSVSMRSPNQYTSGSMSAPAGTSSTIAASKPFISLLQPSAQYTVQSGDTLWQIAQDYLGAGTRWRELQGYTGNPRTMPVGTQISIPSSSSSQPSTVKSSPVSSVQRVSAPSATLRSSTPTVAAAYSPPPTKIGSYYLPFTL